MLMLCWHHRLRAAWSWNEIRANTIKMIISLTTFVGIYPATTRLIENQYNYHILFGWMRKKKLTRSSPNFDRMKLNFGAADKIFSIYEIRWMWTLFLLRNFVCLMTSIFTEPIHSFMIPSSSLCFDIRQRLFFPVAGIIPLNHLLSE